MVTDKESLDWACETAARHLNQSKRAVKLSECEHGMVLEFASRKPMFGKRPGVIWLEIRAYTNPFNPPEEEWVVEPDAPANPETGEPVPTIRIVRYPTLFCFYIHNGMIYRAAIGQSPEIIASTIDAMEAEWHERLDIDELESEDSND